jgi:SNW domain-containing protein 1
MRLSADGRTLQQHSVNEKFAKLSDAFYIAERSARKEIEERNRIQKTMAYKEYMKQEERMKSAALEARKQKDQILQSSTEDPTGSPSVNSKRRNPDVEDKDRKMRDELRYIAKREVEREHRLDVARNKKSKGARDQERDISEKVALGMAQPTVSNEAMYDQRLFNQTSGLDQGFAEEDEYNVYDKPLFQDKTAGTIYGVKEYDDNVDEDEGEKKDEKSGLERIMQKAPHRGFEGAEKRGAPRNKPVEFEKAVSSDRVEVIF